MKKLRLSLLGTMLVAICVLGISVSVVSADEPTSQLNSKTVLTDAQKGEIANIYKDILVKKAQLIEKYVEYGVITEDKSKKIISHMEQRYKRLEANGFIPNCDKYKDSEHKKSE